MRYAFKEIISKKRETIDRGSKDKLANFFYQPISNFFLWIFLNMGLSANSISLIMALVSIIGAIFYLSGIKSLMITGSILFIYAMVLDHTDGDAARITKVFSKKGIFWDHIHHSTEELFTFIGLGIYLMNLKVEIILASISISGFGFFIMGLVASALLIISMYFRATMFWFCHRGGHYDNIYRTFPIVFLYGNFFKIWHILVLLSVLFNLVHLLLFIALVWSIITFFSRMYLLYKDGEHYDAENNNRD